MTTRRPEVAGRRRGRRPRRSPGDPRTAPRAQPARGTTGSLGKFSPRELRVRARPRLATGRAAAPPARCADPYADRPRRPRRPRPGGGRDLDRRPVVRPAGVRLGVPDAAARAGPALRPRGARHGRLGAVRAGHRLSDPPGVRADGIRAERHRALPGGAGAAAAPRRARRPRRARDLRRVRRHGPVADGAAVVERRLVRAGRPAVRARRRLLRLHAAVRRVPRRLPHRGGRPHGDRRPRRALPLRRPAAHRSGAAAHVSRPDPPLGARGRVPVPARRRLLARPVRPRGELLRPLHRPQLHRRARHPDGEGHPRRHRAHRGGTVHRRCPDRGLVALAARLRRRRPARLRDPHRRHLPGDRPAFPGDAERADAGGSLHPAEHRRDPRLLRARPR